MILEINIPGKPIAKKRPRFFRRGNFVGTYSDQKTEESRFMMEIKNQLPKTWDKPTGPVTINMRFGMPVPKSFPKAKAIKIQAGYIVYHDKKPDLDNMEKFVLDCIRDFVISDDAIVAVLKSVKHYSQNPYTGITIERLPE